MYIDPGELNKRIEIYKRVVPAPDADGYATPSLVCVRRPWAIWAPFLLAHRLFEPIT